jgi:hypothetical protein
MVLRLVTTRFRIVGDLFELRALRSRTEPVAPAVPADDSTGRVREVRSEQQSVGVRDAVEELQPGALRQRGVDVHTARHAGVSELNGVVHAVPGDHRAVVIVLDLHRDLARGVARGSSHGPVCGGSSISSTRVIVVSPIDQCGSVMRVIFPPTTL